MRRCRSIAAPLATLLVGVGLWAACVSYDPTGPHAEAVNGTFAAKLITILPNDSATRPDTSILTLTLRDSLYRGRFTGFYRFSDGDSGLVDGTLFPTGQRIEIGHFGAWPPLTYVYHLWRLYPSCTFPQLGPLYIVNGSVHGDTLMLGDTTTVPCSSQQTSFAFQLVGIRQR